MKVVRALLLVALCTAALPLPLAAQAIQHESEVTEAAFPQLQLPAGVFTLGDEEFARVAEKIQLGTARMQERRWFYRSAERYAPFTTMPPADWKVKADKAGKKIAASGPIYTWTPIGPAGDYDVTRQWGPGGSLTQGRATAVWTHMDGPRVVNKNVIFLGFADGGVWKSTDGGKNWTALTDMQPTLAIGALDVVPGSDHVNYSDATIYVMTGEGNFSQPDKDGVGVLKSTDGGRNWTLQALPFQTDAIGVAGQHRGRRIRVDTTIPGAQSVWVAGDGGMYHTADGGATWKLVTSLPYAGAPASAAYPGGCWVEYATDINIGPVNASTGKATLFATFARHRDATCVSPSSNSRQNTGVYRSVDGGATWTRISQAANGFPATPGVVGRMHSFLAPSNPKHMYVVIARSDDYKSLGIFSTLDATATPVQWIAGSTTEFTNGQGWYNLTGAVDPTNENRIMVGGLDNYLSVDGGKTLTKKSGWSAGDTTWAHADHHHAVWVDANTYYDANDGGLNIGHIDGTNVSWTHANGGSLSTLQFYGLGQSATSPYRINAGLQDNGHAYLDGENWVATYGGDGGFAVVDQDNDNHAYEEYVYGSIRKSDDGGDTWPAAGCMQTFGACTGCLGACVPDLHTAFIANFSLDANNQNVMYVGTNVLYRNSSARTAGKVWERIAPTDGSVDFVKGSTASSAYVSIVHSAKAGGTTDVLTKVSKVVYLGTSTGRVWKTSDGGLTWVDLTRAPLPVISDTAGRFVTWIDTDPTNANNVMVTYSGWNPSTPQRPGHVFRSVDGGITWTDISGALPDEPFNTIAVNPNPGENGEVYVASDTGVYVNTAAWTGNTWLRVNSGLLPHVSVNMLQFTNATTPKRLRAATHGRGIWEMEKGSRGSITLDKASYDCGAVVKIAVQDSNRGAGSVTVTIASTAEGEESMVLQETPANSGHFEGTITLTGGTSSKGDGMLRVYNADNLTARYRRKVPGPASVNTFTTSATSDCDACTGSSATGANLRFDPALTTQSISGGDQDESLDNCETGQVNFAIRNAGAGGLTNVRVVRVVPSNAGVRVGAYPATIAQSLAACATAPFTVRVTAGGLTAGENLTLRIDVTSDEMLAQGVTRSLEVTFKDTERDYVFRASKTYSFEKDMEGWQRVSGTFNRQTSGGGGANLTATYIASNTLTDGTCDNVRSPKMKLTATSSMTMYNQFSIEPLNDAWYDRANVGLYDVATGQRSNVAPSFGRTYLADGPNGVCVTAGQPGWAGPGPGWLPATWSAADLGASQRAGRTVQIDVGYGTDPLASAIGFWFDEVTVTNFYEQVADGQSNGCP